MGCRLVRNVRDLADRKAEIIEAGYEGWATVSDDELFSLPYFKHVGAKDLS